MPVYRYLICYMVYGICYMIYDIWYMVYDIMIYGIVWYGMVWYGKCVCMYVRMYVRGICVHDVSLHIYMFTHT